MIDNSGCGLTTAHKHLELTEHTNYWLLTHFYEAMLIHIIPAFPSTSESSRPVTAIDGDVLVTMYYSLCPAWMLRALMLTYLVGRQWLLNLSPGSLRYAPTVLHLVCYVAGNWEESTVLGGEHGSPCSGHECMALHAPHGRQCCAHLSVQHHFVRSEPFLPARAH